MKFNFSKKDTSHWTFDSIGRNQNWVIFTKKDTVKIKEGAKTS
jgi:hypothetical protein